MRALITVLFFTTLNCSVHISKAQTMRDSILVPNIFTPNEDGLNDLFRPTFTFEKHVQGVKLEIFDRFGKLLNTSKNNISWDGRDDSGIPCPDGTYFYVIHFTYNSTKNEYKGFIQLIR